MLRAGSRALSIFTNALNARVLHAHAEKPLSPHELEEALGWAPQSSLRAVVNKMCELNALARTDDAIGAPTELTPAGRELLPVADSLERWLEGAPDGPIPLEDPAAQGIVRVLAAGWDSTVIRALAEQPQTLIELSSTISDHNYPALKRRLGKLRATHLVTPVRTEEGGAYAVSEWLRRAVVPLTYAGRWERRHDCDAAPITAVEIEAALLLALPLAELPARSVGACALAVLTSSEERSRLKQNVAGVAVEIKQGEIVSCAVGTPASQPTWALGTIDAWLDAMVEGRRDALRVSGTKPRLAEGIVRGLHAGLFKL